MSRLSRIARKVNNTTLQKQRAALPPAEQLRAMAAQLRKVAGDDPKVRKLVDAFDSVDQMIFGDGGFVRTGGGEKIQPMELPPELEPYRAQWARTPPENPGEK